MEDRIETLRHCTIMQEFTDEELETIAGVVREKLYANAQSLQTQGEPPKDGGIVFLAGGRVRCEVTDSEAKVLGLGTLSAGDHLGGMRLFGAVASPLSAIAEGDVTCLILDRAAFHQLRQQEPDVAMKLLFSLAGDFGARIVEAGSLFADFAQFAARQANFAERGTFGSYSDFGFDPNSMGTRTQPPK